MGMGMVLGMSGYGHVILVVGMRRWWPTEVGMSGYGIWVVMRSENRRIQRETKCFNGNNR